MKRAGAWLAVLGVLAGLSTPAAAAAPSPERRRQDIASEQRKLRDKIGEAAEQEAELIAELTVSRRLREELDAQVAGLNADITTAARELAVIAAELEAAEDAVAAAEDAAVAAEQELEESTELLREQAVQAFIRFGNSPSVDELVLNLDDVNEAPRLYAYVEAVAERQAQVVERHQRLQEETTLLRARAAEARTTVASRHAESQARRNALVATRAEQAAARAEVAAESAIEQRLLGQVQSQRSTYEQRLQQLERESNDIAALLRRRQSDQGITPSGKGVLRAPLANPVVTSSYGYRVHPIYNDRRLHAGIDLRAATGTPVLAADSGVVVSSGWKSGYGNTVVIDHGGSLATLYAHNSSLVVSAGETVTRGQRIAAAGSTGNSTGPHVHFEVRVSGTPVDPMRYL